MTNNLHERDPFFEQVTTWVGSTPSLILHTLIFLLSGLIGFFHLVEWSTVLLVLTTVVSLEAIYLSIFIQMTVNRHARSLKEVEEDVEDIQEDIQGISEDVEDIQEDVEEMSEEDKADLARKHKQIVTLEMLTNDVRRVLTDLETFKKQ